jgi:hypothetical protein
LVDTPWGVADIMFFVVLKYLSVVVRDLFSFVVFMEDGHGMFADSHFNADSF